MREDYRGSSDFPTISEESDGDSSSREGGCSETSITIDDIDRTSSIPRCETAARFVLRTERENDLSSDRAVEEPSAGASSSSSDRRRPTLGGSGIVSALRRFTFAGSTLRSSSEGGAVNDEAAEAVARGGRRGAIFNPARRGGASAGLFARSQRSNHISIAGRPSSSASSYDTPTNNETLGGGDKVAYCLSDGKIIALRNFIDHWAWCFFMFVGILLLLFGPAVHAIWMPKSTDRAVLVTISVAAFALVVDMVIRCIVDKSYFSLNRCYSRDGRGKRKCRPWIFHLGSFLFWFDVISLLPVILRITNSLVVDGPVIEIEMTEFGYPKKLPLPPRFDWYSPFTFSLQVGTLALMARFIRSFTLIAISSKWNFHYFDPCYWSEELASRGKHESHGDVRDGKLQASQIPLPLASVDVSNTIALSPIFADSRMSKLQETDEFEPDLPKRFFNAFKMKDPIDGAPSTAAIPNIFHRNSASKDSNSQVGTAMQMLTGQRVALGALVAVVLSCTLDWREIDTTNFSTMIFLHGRTANEKFRTTAVDIAHSSVIPFLFNYTRANSTDIIFQRTYDDIDYNSCRDRHIMTIVIRGPGVYTTGHFDESQAWIAGAKAHLATTIYVLMLWVIAEISFGRPVMHLVVGPIERMVRLLSMLMKDPLGYSDSPEYRNLVREEHGTADKWYWTKEMLRGMETHFLMSTIKRIGNLLRVGFGSAGAEIIRDNLERGRNEDVLFLNKKGGTVSCIFLFCDIRQFTDATESLQEEVFVFTNRIASVVHSICHSYEGSANKNIGDAFLVSWRLDEAPIKEEADEDPFQNHSNFRSNSNQADKALLSVVKISIALHYDQYFTDGMSETAKMRLIAKLSNRKGPLVQMGFGLHAGTAVQGAIGSQRKLDATYISESVERAEFLESSTKTYGVPILMSDSFYNLLDPANRRRCRKVDQLLILNEECGHLSDPHEILDNGERMNIYTFDMDIDALWRSEPDDDLNSSNYSDPGIVNSLRRRTLSLSRSADFAKSLASIDGRRNSLTSNDGRRNSLTSNDGRVDIEKAIKAEAATVEAADRAMDLLLPTCIHHYDEKCWLAPDIKKIRRDYVSSGVIFPKYQEGLKAFYSKNWEHAKNCFELVLSQREDGPSRCFLKLIAEQGGVPPKNFIGYNVERG